MKLRSRYGDIWELKETDGGYLWKIPDYTRFGFFTDFEGDICFVDPPGGPFLEVGKEITPGELISGIFEEDKDNILIRTYKKEEN